MKIFKRNNHSSGITLISLIITIVVLVVIASISVFLIINNGIVDKTKIASSSYNKETATDIMNLKITNIKILGYKENQQLPTLQYLADSLCEDTDIEYLVVKNSSVASLEKVTVVDNSSVYTKLKNYPYEFEIDNSLKIASIDNSPITSSESTSNSNQNSNSNINIYVDDVKQSSIPTKDSNKTFGYYTTNSQTSTLSFDITNWVINLNNITSSDTIFNIYFYEKDKLEVLQKILKIDTQYSSASELFANNLLAILLNSFATNYIGTSAGTLEQDFLAALNSGLSRYTTYEAYIDGSNTHGFNLSEGNYLIRLSSNVGFSPQSVIVDGVTIPPIRGNIYFCQVKNRITINWYCYYKNVHKYLYVDYKSI